MPLADQTHIMSIGTAVSRTNAMDSEAGEKKNTSVYYHKLKTNKPFGNSCNLKIEFRGMLKLFDILKKYHKEIITHASRTFRVDTSLKIWRKKT